MSLEIKQERKHALVFMRHSKAEYKRLLDKLFNHPMEPVPLLDPREYDKYPDLTKEGITLAEKKAKELLDKMNPDKDILYIATSPAERAVNTAAILEKIAKERGFNVISQNKQALIFGNKERSIRIFPALSSADMKIPAYLIDLFSDASIYSKEEIESDFAPFFKEGEAWGDEIPEEQQKAWIKAKKTILADDKGNFGANFLYHGPRIVKEFGKYFPELENPVEESQKLLAVILKMFKWGIERFQKKYGSDKNLKIIAVGHEELMFALKNLLNSESQGIDYCEAIPFEEGKVI